MRRAREILKDIIFPQRCMFCNDITAYPHYICEECKINYPLKDMEICKRCGKYRENCICRDLSASVYRMASACPYEGDAINKIKAFKSDKESLLGDDFADMLCRVLSDMKDGEFFPYITYIPMEKEKIKMRGHNMAKTLASKIAQRTGRKLIEPPIEKVYTEKFQHDLKRKERFKNASLSFLDKGNPVEGNIILIDDIITTGATISRASDILVNNGAGKVLALSIASTQKRERQ